MIKDTMVEYQQKVILLQQLKSKRNQLEEQFRFKESEMSNKVTMKIVRKQIEDKNRDLDSLNTNDVVGSDTTYETSSQDELNHGRIVNINR